MLSLGFLCSYKIEDQQCKNKPTPPNQPKPNEYTNKTLKPPNKQKTQTKKPTQTKKTSCELMVEEGGILV